MTKNESKNFHRGADIQAIDVDSLLSAISTNTLPDPITYQYYKGLSENTIVLNQGIDNAIVEYGILPLMRMDQDSKVKEINIILDSLGGEIYSGFAFIAALERCTTPITIHLIGVAASMAGYIAMAKSPYIRVVCDKWTVGLIHAGSSIFEGNTNSVRDLFHFHEEYEKKIKEYVLTHTKIDEKMYDDIERYEFWMSADKMKELGIVDEII